jgi:hypothetical protein
VRRHIFILVVSQTMRFWHNPDEVQNILVGLALVASMPIAGSSTAWSQNASGDLALSLGLVVLSTLLSPLTTPVALHSVGPLTSGDYSEDLHELASSGTGCLQRKSGGWSSSAFLRVLCGDSANASSEPFPRPDCSGAIRGASGRGPP